MQPDSTPATRSKTVHSERPRARRYRFVAGIELTDVHSERRFHRQTTDLNLFGCRVSAGPIFDLGTKVRICITRGGCAFHAFGRIAYAAVQYGMGIAFTDIQETDREILERWIFELRSNHK